MTTEPRASVCWACEELAEGRTGGPVLHPACAATLAGWRADYADLVGELIGQQLAAKASQEGLTELDAVLRAEWQGDAERAAWAACYLCARLSTPLLAVA